MIYDIQINLAMNFKIRGDKTPESQYVAQEKAIELFLQEVKTCQDAQVAYTDLWEAPDEDEVEYDADVRGELPSWAKSNEEKKE